jgi:riboflavin synthase
MFSGIIGYRGTVTEIDALPGGGATLRVRCEGIERERPEPKDSIAIDGVCLTATAIDGGVISFDVIPESLARSSLGQRVSGDRVNVEYALRVGDRVGGHFVYGHVDATVRVVSRLSEGQGERIRIERPPSLAFALVDKAFVAVDGVSLTVAATGDGWFDVAVIPETLARTSLRDRPPGSSVNVEIDPLARYANASRREV